ncbi:bifunctional 3-oxoadipate enol-lactonase/4-carboxymuconolactone decarboxylase PcaDC [Streptomyces sp. NBC_01716]|uniref:bifunctional 3-oxoadipate enol-lactonase/4-carboxymuconolactone decarboxylase PcaDC n=1 Tax=Streptomyces sp. NBC_01716 TaxID=2975917 RepID=UPI002E32EB4F|nr:4-carboxymuconolactone decarboxylase [Streptomyces sp. NBC_01716]
MTDPTAELRLPHSRLDGPADGAPLILGPSLGTSMRVWEPQLAALARDHRVLRWDLPGHGGSVPASAPAVSVAALAEQVVRLADEQGWERFAYAGISLGGAVGLRLAVHHPDRLVSLAVLCSSAYFGAPDSWRDRAATVLARGTESLVASRPGVWFAPGFEDTPPGSALVDDLRTADDKSYAACCLAVAEHDLRDELAAVTVPTLVVAGRDDPAAPPSHARTIADGIPGASLTEIAGAAHLANAERPAPVLAALLNHLEATSPAGASAVNVGDATRHGAGMAVRRAVLGDHHVDRAVARTTAFTAPFQDFITRYAWAEIWTRPGLDRRTRSCVTLTALVAGGHHDELAMHVRAAVRNGLSREEIREVLLQSAVYCGVPAANKAFSIADDVLSEHA